MGKVLIIHLSYMFLVDSNDGALEPFFQTETFLNDEPAPVVLKTGVYRVEVTIEDKWGAKTKHVINQEMVVRKRIIFMVSRVYQSFSLAL